MKVTNCNGSPRKRCMEHWGDTGLRKRCTIGVIVALARGVWSTGMILALERGVWSTGVNWPSPKVLEKGVWSTGMTLALSRRPGSGNPVLCATGDGLTGQWTVAALRQSSPQPVL